MSRNRSKSSSLLEDAMVKKMRASPPPTPSSRTNFFPADLTPFRTLSQGHDRLSKSFRNPPLFNSSFVKGYEFFKLVVVSKSNESTIRGTRGGRLKSRDRRNEAAICRGDVIRSWNRGEMAQRWAGSGSMHGRMEFNAVRHTMQIQDAPGDNAGKKLRLTRLYQPVLKRRMQASSIYACT